MKFSEFRNIANLEPNLVTTVSDIETNIQTLDEYYEAPVLSQRNKKTHIDFIRVDLLDTQTIPIHYMKATLKKTVE